MPERDESGAALRDAVDEVCHELSPVVGLLRLDERDGKLDAFAVDLLRKLERAMAAARIAEREVPR